MKITFEGDTIEDVMQDIEDMASLFKRGQGRDDPKNIYEGVSEKPTTTAIPKTTLNDILEDGLQGPQGPGPEKVIPEVIHTGEIPQKISPPPTAAKKPRTAKQLENDERLRARAAEKAAANKAAKAGGFDKRAAKAPALEPAPVPPPKTAEGMDPAEVVKVRQKTIEDLQSAYANGFQKEVFELLSRFGNGAKSFRELPPESFVPIREAIDNGALT